MKFIVHLLFVCSVAAAITFAIGIVVIDIMHAAGLTKAAIVW